MNDKVISDKELIRAYLTKKGWNKHAFCKEIGLGKSFLDPDSTLTVDSLRRIVQHPAFTDLNVQALIDQDGKHIVKAKDKLSDTIDNQNFILEVVRKITELKTDPERINHEEALKLIEYLDQSLKNLSSLSEEYQTLYKEYQRLNDALSGEAGL